MELNGQQDYGSADQSVDLHGLSLDLTHLFVGGDSEPHTYDPIRQFSDRIDYVLGSGIPYVLLLRKGKDEIAQALLAPITTTQAGDRFYTVNHQIAQLFSVAKKFVHDKS